MTDPKTCRVCGEQKPLDEFPKAKSNRDGHANLCHVCNRAHARAWQIANPEREAAKLMRWQAANRDRMRATGKAYREANRERVAEASREWQRNNPDKRRATLRRYEEANREQIREKARERQRRRDPEERRAQQRAWKARNRDRVAADNHSRRTDRYDEASLVMLRALVSDPCAYCGGVGGEVDHITPLVAGGLNHWTNITSACRSCNARKHARPLLRALLAL